MNQGFPKHAEKITTSNCCELLLDVIQMPGRSADLSLAEWDVLLRLARRTNLISRLADRLNRCGMRPNLPAPVRPHITAALALATHQRQAVLWEIEHIANALFPSDTPIVLLKGTGYVAANLNAAHGRLFGDIDILVPQTELRSVEAALMVHGWSNGDIDPYDDRYYRKWMHELPPMTHCSRGTIIDIHHNILPLTARNHPAPEQLLSSSVALAEAPFRILAPCDMVLHCATHLFHEGELHNGLRDLLDLDALISEFSSTQVSFWTELPRRAKELDLEWPLRLALRYLKMFLNTSIPNDATIALGSSRASDRWHDFMYLEGFQPDHPLCNGYRSRLARAILYLRGHYLRMPMHLIAQHLSRKAFMRLYKNTSRSL